KYVWRVRRHLAQTLRGGTRRNYGQRADAGIGVERVRVQGETWWLAPQPALSRAVSSTARLADVVHSARSLVRRIVVRRLHRPSAAERPADVVADGGEPLSRQAPGLDSRHDVRL